MIPYTFFSLAKTITDLAIKKKTEPLQCPVWATYDYVYTIDGAAAVVCDNHGDRAPGAYSLKKIGSLLDATPYTKELDKSKMAYLSYSTGSNINNLLKRKTEDLCTISPADGNESARSVSRLC